MPLTNVQECKETNSLYTSRPTLRGGQSSKFLIVILCDLPLPNPNYPQWLKDEDTKR